jgi:hypothetical protein
MRNMKSPFPGMDPYLERNWGDVHSSIIYIAKQALPRTPASGPSPSTEFHFSMNEFGQRRTSVRCEFLMQQIDRCDQRAVRVRVFVEPIVGVGVVGVMVLADHD